MKSGLLILAILLISLTAFPKCKSGTISVWPYQSCLNLNPVLVITGYGFHPKFVKQALGKYPAYLQSDNDRVPLFLAAYYIGSFQSYQVLLKPVRNLKANTAYRLAFDSLPTDDYYGIEKFLVREWATEDFDDNSPPKFVNPPSEKDKELIYYGCGPSIYVDFGFEVEEESAYLVKTALTEASNGKTWVFYLAPLKTTISIGHGMCTGEFELEVGAKYEVAFSLMDASGNRSETPTNKIAFTAPSEETPFASDPPKPPRELEQWLYANRPNVSCAP